MSKIFPTTFSIEVALGCNLKCPECAIGGGFIDRKKGYMSFANFKIIADKAKPYVKYMYLHLWGEPLLNPEIYEMISYASAFTKTNISTNANNLNRESCEKLILSGVTDVIVSIDGVTQDVYQQYRIGGNAQKVYENLKHLVELNNLYKNKVNLIPQFIAFQHNEHEIDTFKGICKELNIMATIKAPYIRHNSLLHLSTKIKNRRVYTNFEEYKTVLSGCVNPYDVFTILLDGSVVVCCYDHNGSTTMGNIFSQSVEDIYFGDSFNDFRETLQQKNIPDFCKKECLMYQFCGEMK